MGAELSRRSFLKTSATASGGLMLNFSLGGCATTDLRDLQEDAFAPNAWLEITPENRFTFTLDRVEMGQGTATGLTTLMAEELDVDPELFQVEFAPAAKPYRNPDYGLQLTGGSNSLSTSWIRVREAGATAKGMLIDAAARVWRVDASRVKASDGKCFNQQTGAELSYGDLVGLASKSNVRKYPLKNPRDFKYIGKQNKRLDADEKVFAEAKYGVDTQLPGMVYAVCKRAPVYGAPLVSFDAGEAKRLQGVLDVFQLDNKVVVIADKYWRARKGADLVKAQWEKIPQSNLSQETIFEQYKQLAESEKGKSELAKGNVEKALKDSQRVVEVEYRFPYLAHATMEPMNCTASVTDDKCEIWAGTQAADASKALAALETGIPAENVHIHSTYIGGGFGRRIAQDYLKEAVQISNKIKSPVKLIWSREEDIKNDLYRPLTYHKMTASVNRQGHVDSWHHKIVAPRILSWLVSDTAVALIPAPFFRKEMVLRKPMVNFSMGFAADRYENYHDFYEKMLMLPKDPSPIEGAESVPYEFANVSVDHVYAESPFPITFWRSVGHSQNAFAVESFVDELAHLENQDPVVYRRNLLRGHNRDLGVLERAAELSGWRKNKGHFYGVACHKSFGTYVAQVAEISVENNDVKIHKITCVVDCGVVVNPDVVTMQMESGIIFGLSAALYGEINHNRGRVKQSNFHDYRLVTMNTSPDIQVDIIASSESPTGVGEPGLPPIAPALANAIFAATGKRLRTLPLKLS